MARKKTTTKRTKRVSKKQELETMQVADGKTDVEEIRNLEKIMGVHQVNPFKTNTLEVFEENKSPCGHVGDTFKV